MRITTMMGTKKEVMMQLNHSNSDNNANRWIPFVGERTKLRNREKQYKAGQSTEK
jgi:hypothetical protein